MRANVILPLLVLLGAGAAIAQPRVAFLAFHDVTITGHCGGGARPLPTITLRKDGALTLNSAEIQHAVCNGFSNIRVNSLSLPLTASVSGTPKSANNGFDLTSAIQGPLTANVTIGAGAAEGHRTFVQVEGFVHGSLQSQPTCPSVLQQIDRVGPATYDIAQQQCGRSTEQTLIRAPGEPASAAPTWFSLRTYLDLRATTADSPGVRVNILSWYLVEDAACPTKVEQVSGEVTWSINNGPKLPVTVGMRLCKDYAIETGVDSSITMSGLAGMYRFTVDEMASFQVSDLSTKDGLQAYSVQLAMGKVSAVVNPKKAFQVDFKVRTPSGTTSVRGTTFTTQYDPALKATTVSVEEGEVLVTGAEDLFPPTSPAGLPLTLRAGQRVRVTAESVGAVLANPGIDLGGVVDAAGFRVPVARGAIASVFGTGFTTGLHPAVTVPLPTVLGGASVRVNGQRAPLFFASPGLINFQVPMEAPLNGEVEIVVESDGAPSLMRKVAVQSYAPSIFTYARAGGTDPIVVHLDGSLVTPQSPAEKGENLVVFATGVGDLTDPAKTNEPALVSPLAKSRTNPEVKIGGIAAEVLFVGPTPGFIGLIQLNIKVAPGTPSGNAPLVIGYGLVVSQPGLNLAVK